MDLGVSGKVAVITGGATGIGRAIADAFHQEGAHVVINGRTQEKLDKACEEIGSRAHGVVADLLQPEGAQTLAEFARGIGPVDFLVNNIGIFDVNDFFEVSDDRWLEYFQHNILEAGAHWLSVHFEAATHLDRLMHRIRQKGGRADR